MNRLITRTFEDRDRLDKALAVTVANILETALEERGRASLVVSGGSTPLRFFQHLSEKELGWGQVTVLLADERWVPSDHDDSNEKLIRENLLINAARDARFIPFKIPSDSAADAEQELETSLAALGQFDLVILGMGTDGHTASLFPDAKELDKGLDMKSGQQCIAVTPLIAPHVRMSMTLPRILNSRQVFIHITGEKKMQVFEEARKQNNPRLLPIAAVANQTGTPVTLYFAP